MGTVQLQKIFSFLFVINFAFVNIIKAQTPTNCLEIESILVDACGTPEGENEMVRFKIGPSPINVSNLNVNWPNNSFLGISPVNATTNNIVSSLNGTILSCGFLVQPVGGILPAGKTVLLITSTNISLSANSFANLTDTLYVIFQNAGNTSGHFANYSTPSGLRTLTISTISPVCSDAVTYDKVLLTNQSGGYGGTTAQKDGATVEFSWAGVANYVNNGCEAPFVVNTSNAGAGGSICTAGTISLTGSASGNYTGVIWQGGQGTFSSSSSLTTNYTANAAESGTIVLSLGIIGHCSDTVFSTVNITINSNPVMTSSNASSLCSGDALNFSLTGSVPSTYSWSAADNSNTTGESLTSQTSNTLNNTIINNSGSIQTVIYTVTPTSIAGSCPGTSQTINITVNPTPSVSSSDTATMCSGATVNISLTANPASSFSWIASDNVNTFGESLTNQTTSTLVNTITNNTTSSQIVVYTVTPTATSGGCSGIPQTINVTVDPIPTMTSASSGTICSGNAINIPLTSNVPSSYTWIAADNSNTNGESLTAQTSNTLNNTIINNSISSQVIVYTVTPLSSTGSCSGISQTITVSVNPTPSITSVNSATICSGNSVNISLTSDIASSYSWVATDNANTTGESLTNQTTASLNNTITNNSTTAQTVVYNVIPTSGGCSGSSQTINVIVNPVPVISGTATVNLSSCGSSDGSVTGLTANGLPTLTYTWSNSFLSVVSTSSTTADLTGQPVGNYTLVVSTSSNSCFSSAGPFSIGNAGAPAPPTANSNGPVCEGTSLNLTSDTVAGAIYGWTGPNGFVSNQQDTIVSLNATGAMTGNYFVTITVAGCTSLPGIISVTVNPLPSAVISPAGSTTFCAGNSVTLNGSGIGTSFLWMPGSVSSSSISPTTAGTYMYIASNGCGTDTASEVITVNPLPTALITPGGPTTFCSGDSVTLTASGIGTYSWSTGSTANSISVLSAGTYTLTSTNSCGTQQATQTITINPLPSASINPSGSTTFCAGNSVTLNGSGIGTSFLWMPGSVSSSSISPTTAGIYMYIASNGCGTDTASEVITVNPLPTALITPGGATTFCSGDSVTLTASGIGTYSWSTGSTANSISVLLAGTYTLTSTNSCGTQQATQTITINPLPSASINPSGSTTFCAGNSVTLNGSGIGTSFLWMPGSVSSSSISPTTAGTYMYIASNGCGTDTASEVITVNPLPTALITPGGATTFCSGDSVTLTASGIGTYSWSTGSTANSISVLSAGTYTLTSTNSCGTQQAIQNVTIIQQPSAAITTSGNTNLCLGENATLSASGGNSYVWSTGQTSNSINVNTGGNYWVIASNNCGVASDSLNINVDSVTALFSPDLYSGTYPLIVNFTNSSSSNAINYSWTFGDGNTSSSISPSNTFEAPGTYSANLTVTNSNGCTDSYSVTIIVLENPSSLEMPNVFTPNGDGKNDQFMAISKGISEFECSVYDRWGLKMADLTSVKNGWDGHTAAGSLANDGTYFYMVKAKGFDKKEYNLQGFVQLISK